MAASPTPKVTTVTCPTCDVTVTQAPGTRRTICPHCGHFYSPEAARINSRRPSPEQSGSHGGTSGSSSGYGSHDNRLPQLAKHDKDKNGSRLHTLASFFSNLGPNRRAKSGDSSSSGSTGKRMGTSPVPNHMHNELESQLPPIAQDSKGRLTVDTPTHSRPRSSQPSSGATSPGSEHLSSSSGGPGTRITDWQGLAQSSNAGNNNNKVVYPIRTKTYDQIRNDIKVARETGSWKEVQEFYATTFDSFLELNAAFKRDPNKEYKTPEDPGIRFDYVNKVYDLLEDLPQEIQKVVLKAIINSLLKDKRPHTKDDLRAYLILVQNPQFSNIATYVIFAHLLRQVAALSDHDHHFLVNWFRRLSKDRFSSVVQRLHNFISCRLFPPKPEDLPPMSKCTWWIPSATKVLALLNAANHLTEHPKVSYMDFYNSTLDHLDLMAEYYTWQNPSTHPGFSFCQYPFILSIAAKRSILQRDSEQQMIVMARRSLVAKVQQRQLPDIGMLFLNLTVRRSHLVSDSLNEIARKQHDLKKKLKVTFVGEAGLDMGGLTKEWFLLLIRQIFRQEYGMFTYNKKARFFWFSSAPCENYQEFNLVGVLMGLAVYNSIILDIHFPPCCYKKLLSPAVVPFNHPNATVGIFNATLEDLKQSHPEVAHGLRELEIYEGDVEDDFGVTFQISYDELGVMKTHDLKPKGETIPVTNKNRKEYIQMYVDFLLNKSIYRQFQAFYHGFHSVCASNALILAARISELHEQVQHCVKVNSVRMLRPEEVEMLVCGSPTLNMAELKKVVVYEGYTANDQTVRYFWEVVQNFAQELQKRLLLFTTGSDRIPIGGMSEMQFKITRTDNTDMLPSSHTCFNQLVLPAYKSRKMLKQKLTIAIQNAEGFGIE